jgi:hypothetical protein
MIKHRFTNITAAVLLLLSCGCGNKSDAPTESSQNSATPNAAQPAALENALD